MLKRGKKPFSFSLNETKTGCYISADKRKDVERLLIKQFGKDWSENQSLFWYKDILYNQDKDVEYSIDENVGCSCLEEDVGTRV